MKLKLIYKILFLLGFLGEMSLITFYKGLPDIYTAPILWIIAGLTMAFTGVQLLVFQKDNEIQTIDSQLDSKKTFTVLSIFAIAAVIVPFAISKTFAANPIDPLASDVIPTIEILVRRLLKGEWVYAPIDFPGWTVNNAYLPLQYMPFILAELTKIDYRWLAYLSFVIVILFWLKYVLEKDYATREIVLKTIVVFLILLFINQHDVATFAFSLELIDVAFYLFLALSFFHKSWKIRSLAILGCLLSRYAFVFWLPFYAISYWIENGKKDALKITTYVIAGVIIIYVLPFLTKQPMLFFDGLKYYDKTANGEWVKIPSWFAHVGKPYHLVQGLSTSIFFYDYAEGDIAAKLGAARKTQMLLTIASVLLAALAYWRWQMKENFNYDAFILLSLKFYFVFFYGFFYVPFSYLYVIPMLFSVAILYKIKFVE